MSTIFQKLAPGQPEFTTETQTGAWERQFAFGALEPTAQIFHAPFDQLQNSYVRPNAVVVVSNGNGGYANYFSNYNIGGRIAYFCDDTDFNDKHGGLDTWTREVATLPANYADAESYNYPYPGYYMARSPVTHDVTAKLQKDFFLIGDVTAGASYATQFDIPSYTAQNFAWATGFSFSRAASNWTSSGVVVIVGASLGDPLVFDGYLANTNANLVITGSVPNLSTYQNWVAADNANGLSFSIEAQDSVLEHYRGNIWVRTRRFVKAR